MNNKYDEIRFMEEAVTDWVTEQAGPTRYALYHRFGHWRASDILEESIDGVFIILEKNLQYVFGDYMRP